MSHTNKLLLAVGCGGVIGALLRYAISLLFHSESSTAFPWGTLIVNLVGAFFLSLLLFQPSIEANLSSLVFPALTTGILGSFTTFSTIIVETAVLWQSLKWIAILYCSITFLGGIACSFAGYFAARKGVVK